MFFKRAIKILMCAVSVAALTLLSGCRGDNSALDTDGLQIYCFSAGKADAFLLTTENSAVLIDTVEKSFGDEIVPYLKNKGIDRVDCMIITHFDKDHVGGAEEIINSVSVDTVLQSNCPKNSEAYAAYVGALESTDIEPVTVREVYSFELDGVKYTVDPPAQESYKNNPSNNSSLIVSAVYGSNSFLFTADAQNARLKEYLAEHTESYDFLKVPYHGHYQKQLDTLFNTVRPEYAVITSSDEIPEDEQTISLLSETGVKTFLTRTAAVIVNSDGKTISVKYAD